jgi:hypothetical protein
MAFERVITLYCDAWNEPDPDRRAELLWEVWAPHGTYTDPTVHLEGASELAAHIGRVSEKYPGSHIAMTSLVDAHHRVLRFTWCRIMADGRRLPEGIDFGEVADDGRLLRVVGFFGPIEKFLNKKAS